MYIYIYMYIHIMYILVYIHLYIYIYIYMCRSFFDGGLAIWAAILSRLSPFSS